MSFMHWSFECPVPFGVSFGRYKDWWERFGRCESPKFGFETIKFHMMSYPLGVAESERLRPRLLANLKRFPRMLQDFTVPWDDAKFPKLKPRKDGQWVFYMGGRLWYV
ncbi:hypothetical protein E1B28_013423 [Marasmius oreades]|uniref:Uncharacterized protein n=1 Tax=Marasmius oreades TaxID=181124 RepID=A0A9P7RQ60_9AGAR|nr:uncharacterized protein E1B28_013423 [Marasmius oreades]KAG7087457.1 hypothetical protein E1B28_013423 [Marasmius oreades]